MLVVDCQYLWGFVILTAVSMHVASYPSPKVILNYKPNGDMIDDENDELILVSKVKRVVNHDVMIRILPSTRFADFPEKPENTNIDYPSSELSTTSSLPIIPVPWPSVTKGFVAVTVRTEAPVVPSTTNLETRRFTKISFPVTAATRIVRSPDTLTHSEDSKRNEVINTHLYNFLINPMNSEIVAIIIGAFASMVMFCFAFVWCYMCCLKCRLKRVQQEIKRNVDGDADSTNGPPSKSSEKVNRTTGTEETSTKIQDIDTEKVSEKRQSLPPSSNVSTEDEDEEKLLPSRSTEICIDSRQMRTDSLKSTSSLIDMLLGLINPKSASLKSKYEPRK